MDGPRTRTALGAGIIGWHIAWRNPGSGGRGPIGRQGVLRPRPDIRRGAPSAYGPDEARRIAAAPGIGADDIPHTILDERILGWRLYTIMTLRCLMVEVVCGVGVAYGA